jgi:hypothetical protein
MATPPVFHGYPQEGGMQQVFVMVALTADGKRMAVGSQMGTYFPGPRASEGECEEFAPEWSIGPALRRFKLTATGQRILVETGTSTLGLAHRLWPKVVPDPTPRGIGAREILVSLEVVPGVSEIVFDEGVVQVGPPGGIRLSPKEQ